jgi:carboxymethylenebutenolidase
MAATNPPASDPVPGATVAPDDPAIVAGMLTYPSGDAAIHAYLARPSDEERHPAVLICHENRGLLPHFKDVARRLALQGYVALAVDVLSHEGGTEAVDAAEIPAVLSAMPREQIVADFQAGVRYLQGRPEVQPDRIAMTGFCFGGGLTWRCATQKTELRAAVPFYGPNPPLEEVPQIEAAVLAIYGGNDTRINVGIDDITAAMAAHGKVFDTIIYPDAEHAFFNDTGQRYKADAAADAWERLLDWLRRFL